MQIRIVTDQPWDVAADVLAVPLVGDPDWGEASSLGQLDRRAGGGLRELASFGELRSKRFVTALAAGGDGIRAERLLAIGGGDADGLDAEAARRVAATAERRLAGRRVRRLAIWLGPLAEALDGGDAVAAEVAARGVVEGSFDPKAMYRADADDLPPEIEELVLVASTRADVPALERTAERGRVIGEGENLARQLANRSAVEVTPEALAEEARSLASKHGLWIDVIDERRAAELGMGMFLAVGRGSDNPPRMIVLRSGGEGEKDARGRHLALVGKGVCFDSGGISIKPSDRMEEMKMDKTGACTVIAAIATAARLAPGTPLLAVAPAVENMPGAHSTRPGDVVRALNGKYVDITNTDAEGRLILGDAMTYAERLGATHLVDVATLTGAIARAFGHLVTGAFGTPQAWYDEVAAAGVRAGERYWQMPLVDEYWSEMESWYGDFVNAGSADGGGIKSALFLREFRTVPWVHLDIAGTAYFRKETPYAPRGATGASVATLVELALEGAA
ncbi:MAG TPA: leucyl aminopeptidase [Candidatus Limnocylindrales bacterium]|nr:leucyl aminopeptidase [Candidatus Limnocylindrales bacterium]